MSELDAFRATYFDECAESLLALEDEFTALAEGDRDPERLNAVFRAIHSIKGGAGAFGFTQLVDFAHAYETLLDEVRRGNVALSAELVALAMRANDLVEDFVSAARQDMALPENHGRAEREQFALLCGADEASGPVAEDFDIPFTPIRVALAEEDGDGFETPPLPRELGGWSIRFTPLPTLHASGSEPQQLLRALAALGDAEITATPEALPAPEDFDPHGAYCSWHVALMAPGVSEADIREIFEFVEGDCVLAIEPLATAPADPVAPVPPAPSLDRLDIAPAEGMSFAELLAVEAPVPSPPPSSAAVMVAMPGPADGEAAMLPPAQQSIRVDLDKVDRVVDMVGELVIAQSMLGQQMDETLRARHAELVRGLEVLAQATRGLQDAVMAIRAQPVKTVFSRMPRLLRELAQKTGKAMRLDMVGEATEIDKTVIEQLSDPLTHMIRNSADHGIETPERRRAAGKPETGTITLSAAQAGSSIVIAVEDDGAGIDRARVLQLARERGLVAPDMQPSDEQIDNLIFAPGFSTAEAVSDISGRGVGMDVVLNNIRRIGGVVSVRSVPGRGTRMTLRLPLTLAVLDVMLVRVAGCPYVIPLSSILETMQASRMSFSRLPGGGAVLNIRGDYVQVIDLAQRFNLPGTPDGDRFVVLCDADATGPVALVVDSIVGQQQVVIKSLEENFERIEGIAGGTILGDGSVALIVDAQGLRQNMPQRSAA